MAIIKRPGALIETGVIDGFTYEVRDPKYPIVYVFRYEGGKLIGKQTQQGGDTGEAVARMLIAELPKGAA